MKGSYGGGLRRWPCAIAFGVLMFLIPRTSFGGPYTIAGPPASLTNSGWDWDSSNLADFRGALSNAANFGPGGTVSTSIAIQFLSDYSNLSGVNAIIAPWWPNSAMTVTTLNQITTYFQHGGNLLLYQDDPTHDPVGAALGLPTVAQSGTPWTITPPFSNGPFGSATSIGTGGNYGYFNASDIAAKNAIVAGTDPGSLPTVAYWTPGLYCPTCGAMLLVGDIDTISTAYGQADYAGMNQNAKFALNSIAWLVNHSGTYSPAGTQPTTSSPEPGTFLLLASGLLTLALWRRPQKSGSGSVK